MTKRKPKSPKEKQSVLREWFRKFAASAAIAVGSPWAFVIATASVVIWACLGPKYQYDNTWQLVINTSTTIVTFLMVFLIQNTQNRDGRAIQLKLDEIIFGTKGLRNKLVDLEDCSDEELEQFEREFKKLREKRGLDGSEAGKRESKPAAK